MDGECGGGRLGDWRDIDEGLAIFGEGRIDTGRMVRERILCGYPAGGKVMLGEDGAVVQVARNDEGGVRVDGGENAGHVDAETQGSMGGGKEEVGTQDEEKDEKIGDGNVFFHFVSAFWEGAMGQAMTESG